MPVFDIAQARSAKRQIRARGGDKRVRTVKIPGRPDLYATVHVVGKEGPKGGRTVVVVHKRKGAHAKA